MRTHGLRFLSLLLTALAMGPGLAHVLELPVKLSYDPDLYTAVTSTLYRYFGWVGGPIQVGAILVVGLLCWQVRRRPSFGLTLAAWVSLIIGMALWASIVQPVNVRWAEVLQTDPQGASTLYAELRRRWEFGHVASFIAWTIGFSGLVASILREIPYSNGRQDT